ncbi:hypothetical protein SODALDRAFT_116912 [Sodiomyces alkalinus F11]|uniref:Uncharacterized protein n=1 Tax=Sodiomyces alkalinus (strain CBS 110278 / VKM F-3762 / F11) TaxID=1314773 RepID=A0A3N2Q3N7_SODAK|nr:hypothetical protein SODALDRAFT_116912 [Sodiomyces alkalinus F11]ROT41326.1 hypothetical protein SODALDRAFT_116912 [Sodiomyces alkalinus F11]
MSPTLLARQPHHFMGHDMSPRDIEESSQSQDSVLVLVPCAVLGALAAVSVGVGLFFGIKAEREFREERRQEPHLTRREFLRRRKASKSGPLDDDDHIDYLQQSSMLRKSLGGRSSRSASQSSASVRYHTSLDGQRPGDGSWPPTLRTNFGVFDEAEYKEPHPGTEIKIPMPPPSPLDPSDIPQPAPWPFTAASTPPTALYPTMPPHPNSAGRPYHGASSSASTYNNYSIFPQPTHGGNW